MKFLAICSCVFFCMFTIQACHGCPPPPPHYRPCYYGGYYSNSGLWTAAAITSIVANGLNIYSNLTYPRTVVVQQPVVQQQPVIIQQPVVTTPQIVQQYQQPVVIQQKPKQIITYPNGQQTVIY